MINFFNFLFYFFLKIWFDFLVFYQDAGVLESDIMLFLVLFVPFSRDFEFWWYISLFWVEKVS